MVLAPYKTMSTFWMNFLQKSAIRNLKNFWKVFVLTSKNCMCCISRQTFAGWNGKMKWNTILLKWNHESCENFALCNKWSFISFYSFMLRSDKDHVSVFGFLKGGKIRSSQNHWLRKYCQPNQQWSKHSIPWILILKLALNERDDIVDKDKIEQDLRKTSK